MEEDRQKMNELLEEVARLQMLLRTDELTGVLTRRAILDDALVLFRVAYSNMGNGRSVATALSDLSVLFVDIDDFKVINDTYGHAEGDRVLRGIGSVLQASIREGDLVGRIGGEEFMVVLVNTGEIEAGALAERVQKGLTTLSGVTQKDAQVTASIGVASLGTSHANTFEDLVRFADIAMYEAKHRQGKNAIVRYSELTF